MPLISEATDSFCVSSVLITDVIQPAKKQADAGLIVPAEPEHVGIFQKSKLFPLYSGEILNRFAEVVHRLVFNFAGDDGSSGSGAVTTRTMHHNGFSSRYFADALA